MRSSWFLHTLLLCSCLGLAGRAHGQVVINEVMYHPVEQPAFAPDGHPVLDLTEDVHEYIELFNAGGASVNLSGWRLSGGIEYLFPQGVTLPSHGYLVVAKDPARLLAVSQYALSPALILGPYTGQLGNSGDSIQLENAASQRIDAVSYADSFPWPSAADALGAAQRWTGIDPMTAQYRGRSLERVSALHAGSDPANWRASPWPGEPSPGRPNPGQGQTPPPIVTSVKVAQVSDGQPIIGTNQPAQIEVTFSTLNQLGAVHLEYFLDNVNRVDEPRSNVVMTANGRVFSATLPGFRARTVVRYRVWAELLAAGGGASTNVVLPRSDDAYAWRGYFVTPPRQTTNIVAHHILISTNATRQLLLNLNENPLTGFRVPLGTEPNGRWNETQPAVMGYNGEVYDVHVRHSGSYWRRSPGLRSYKIELPRYSPVNNGKTTLLLLAKDSINALGYRIYEAAGLPTSRTRWVELYFLDSNFDGFNTSLTRLDIDEHDEVVFERYQKLQASLHPDRPVEPIGLVYKSSGITSDVGPYGLADGRALLPNEGWTPLQRYEWNYSSKLKDWVGYLPLQELCEQLAAARGPGPGLNLPALRAYLEANWDIDAMLTYLSIRNWMGAVDDTHHNYFMWRQANGRWSMLGWDLDSEMGQTSTNRSIFNGENGNFFKDSVLQAFREEYKQKLYWLNNTLLDPENLITLGIQIAEINGFGIPRQAYVNSVLGYGPFHKPRRPTPLFPLYGESVAGGASCQASPYAHTLQPAPAHASTLWRIRETDTAERTLVYSVTSTVHLTSLPIPFAQLETGRRYSWQCVYYDANGHPSAPTTEAEFRFGGGYQRRELVKIDGTTTWRYIDSSTNLGSAWRVPSYDDNAWAEGPALLGVSAATLAEPIRTPLPLGRRYYYFRKKFVLPNDPARTSLRLRHIIDDAAIFYLNGVELARTNITIFSTVAQEVSDPIYTGQIPLAPANLLAGENVIAVELQQFNTNSADVVFGLSLEATVEVGSGIRLNEIMASNRSAVPHNSLYPDWIELYNPSDTPASLNGYSLTDDPLAPLKFIFPSSTVVAPREFLVVWCDTDTLASGLHTGFNLRTEGESIRLFGPGVSGPVELDQVTFGLQLADRSIGRVADGTGLWQLATPTPNGPNETVPLGSPQALRINEWMASPTSGPDWFEIFNPELTPVAVGGFFLADDLGTPTNSPVPALSFLDAWSFKKFIADNDLAAGADHVGFRLSAGGETIALFDSSHSLIDSVQFGSQVVGVSEGRLPDGNGPSGPLLNGASPGVSNAGDADADGLPNAYEQAHQLNPLSSLDAALDSDGDGLSNLEEYLAGTNPRASGDVLKFDSIGWDADLPGDVQLTFRARAGKVYEVQVRDDLSAGSGSWQVLSVIGPESGDRIVSVTDPKSSGRFYRLVLKRA